MKQIEKIKNWDAKKSRKKSACRSFTDFRENYKTFCIQSKGWPQLKRFEKQDEGSSVEYEFRCMLWVQIWNLQIQIWICKFKYEICKFKYEICWIRNPLYVNMVVQQPYGVQPIWLWTVQTRQLGNEKLKQWIFKWKI